MSEVTKILQAIERGEKQAADELLPLVYDELRKLAAAWMAQEKPGQTLQATALVNEAYLRLVDAENGQQWNGRGHFFAAAAQAMRRILVENARRKNRQKRGGDLKRVELTDAPDIQNDDRILALDEELSVLAQEDPLAAKVVELHHFTGLSYEQVAVTLHITVHEVRTKWAYAKAWLTDAMKTS